MAYDDPAGSGDSLSSLISALLADKGGEAQPAPTVGGYFGSAANAPVPASPPQDPSMAAPAAPAAPTPSPQPPLPEPTVRPVSAWDIIPRAMMGQPVREAAMDAHAANTAQAAQQAGYLAPPPRPVGGGFGGLLGNMLTNGWLEHEQDRTYQRQVANVQQRNLLTAISQIQDPDEYQYAINDPQGWLKAKGSEFEARVVKGGESISSGHKGTLTTAPLLTNDNGRFVTQLPGSTTITGYSGPKVGANGIDERTGKQFPIASTPVVPAGSTPWNVVTPGNASAAQPVIGGSGLEGLNPSGPAAPGGAAPVAPPTVGLGPSNGSVPRGIRNGNPLNVRALPAGNWLGQTGTDPAGYAQFADPAKGIRAAKLNLTNYAKLHGIDTVAGAISRWAPAGADGNATGPYINHVSQALGVNPTDKIDLTDPTIQGKMIDAMGEVENGPQAYQAWKGAGSPAVGAGQASAPPAAVEAPPQGALLGGFSGGSATPMGVPARTHLLGADDPRMKAFPPGAAVQEQPDGTLKAEGGFTPEVVAGMRKEVYTSPEYKQYAEIVPLVRSMRAAASDPSAAADLNLIEAAGRTFNPNAVVRQGTVKAFQETQGVPDIILGALKQINTGKGNQRLSNDTRTAIINQVESRAQQLRKALQPTLDAYGTMADQAGIKRNMVLPPVDELGSAASARPAPKVGEVVNGYKYLGGDPHQRSSWTN